MPAARPDAGRPDGARARGSSQVRRRVAAVATRSGWPDMYHALYENSLVGILLTIPDGRVLAANPAACRMLRRTEREICTLGRDGLVDPHDENLAELLERRARRGRVEGELRFTCGDGTVIPVRVWSAVFQTDDGPRTSMLLHDLSAEQEAAAEVRRLSRRLLAVQEEERRNLSFALHHELGSMIVGVDARLLAVERELEAGRPGKALASLQHCRRLLAASVARLKAQAVALRPPDLDVVGVAAALREHCARMKAETSVQISFASVSRAFRLPPAVETALFRAGQECVSNALRHARARHVRVRLVLARPVVRLTVADDGKGFDPARLKAQPGRHLGLCAVRELVAAQGGTLQIESAPGKGTAIRISIPAQRCQS